MKVTRTYSGRWPLYAEPTSARPYLVHSDSTCIKCFQEYISSWIPNDVLQYRRWPNFNGLITPDWDLVLCLMVVCLL